MSRASRWNAAAGRRSIIRLHGRRALVQNSDVPFLARRFVAWVLPLSTAGCAAITGLDDLTVVTCDVHCDVSSTGDVDDGSTAKSDAAGADSEADVSDSQASDTFDGGPGDASIERGSTDARADSGSSAADVSTLDAAADRDADVTESGMPDVRAGS